MNETCTDTREIVKDAKALRLVSPAYAGRGGVLTAALQYLYQAVVLGAEHTETARRLEKIGGEKLRQMQVLASLIQNLGANPVFSACPPYPVSYFSASCVDYSRTLPAALAADLRLERGAIERYTTILSTLENPRVAEIIAALREECRAHLSQIRLLAEE